MLALLERVDVTATFPSWTLPSAGSVEGIHFSQSVCGTAELSIYIAEDWRGKGIGRALINGVYQQAKLAGSPHVYWQTHQTNHTAMQLYDKVAEKTGIVVYRKVF